MKIDFINMKINNKDKINEYFNDVKSEIIFKALKERSFKGVRRYEINHLLKTYNMNQVYSYLKIRYKKNNYLYIYSISLILFLTIFLSFIAYNQFYLENNIIDQYLNLRFVENFKINNFFNILLIMIMINFFLILYELIIKIRNIKFIKKIKT